MPEDSGPSLKYTELRQIQDEAKNDLLRMIKRLSRLSALVAAAGIGAVVLGAATEESGPAAAIAGFVMIVTGSLAYYLSPLLIALLYARPASDSRAQSGGFGQAWMMIPASTQIRLVGLGLGIVVVVVALINLQLNLEWLNTATAIMALFAGVLFFFPSIGAAFMPRSRRVVLPVTSDQTPEGSGPSAHLVVDPSVSASRRQLIRWVAGIATMLLASYGVATGVSLLTGLALILAAALAAERFLPLAARLFPNRAKSGPHWSVSHTLLLILFIGGLAGLSFGAVIGSGLLTVGGVVLFIATPLIVLGVWLIGKLRAGSISDS